MDVAKGVGDVDPNDTELGMDTYTHFQALAIYKFVKAFIEANLNMTGELVDPNVDVKVTGGSGAAAVVSGQPAVIDVETKSTKFEIDEEFTQDPVLGEIDQFGRKRAE